MRVVLRRSVGEAGVLGALSMIGIGTLMSLLTAFSLCALATNGKIRGGGAYYLISRSLGPEMGGAIGVSATPSPCDRSFNLHCKRV